MVKIAPLDGITYNLDKVCIDDVVAPPYDVIPEDDQDALYERSSFNIVRLILNKVTQDDNDQDNRYTRAAADFKKWTNEEVLQKAQKPCIYYYVQKYTTPKGQTISRKGFIAKNFIEEYETKNILPHEYTMGGPKQDRLNLMKSCEANFSQIFMAYSDPEKEMDKALELPEKPFVDVTDDQGVQNILYIIDDEEVIKKAQKIMENKTLLIADGHHRYETSIAYRDFMRSQKPNAAEDAPFNYVMCYYTNLDDENLIVYPTHRIVTKRIDAYNLLESIKKYFDIVEFTFDSVTKESTKERFDQELEQAAKTEITMGLCLKNVNKYYLLKLKDKDSVNQILSDKGTPDVLKKLDLSVLHQVILEEILNFTKEEQMAQEGVKYIKKEEEAFEALDKGEAEAVFVMASPKIKDIKDISEEGYKMPQKSTYFYPKLLSGLVINPLDA